MANENEALPSVSVTISPTFWENFKGAILLIPHQGKLIWILHSIFPLAGLFLLIFPPLVGQHLSVGTILVAVFCGFGFSPMIFAMAIAIARRTKLAEPPITYRLDNEGVHVSGKAFAQDFDWSAVSKC